MKQCLCFWVLSGNRPATVCMFCVLVQIALCTRMQDICERQSVYVSMWKGLSNGRGTYSGIRGSYPIHLRLTQLREVTAAQSHLVCLHSCYRMISALTSIFKGGVSESQTNMGKAARFPQNKDKLLAMDISFFGFLRFYTRPCTWLRFQSNLVWQ